jgi:uncharacterized lipoprotein NlpE involved in copper resistance
MKKIIIGVFALVLCFTVVGCGNKNKEELNINCQGETTTIQIKKNAKFKCKLLTDEYEFKITKIAKEEITIEASDYGLAQASDNGTINLPGQTLEKLTILRGEEVVIASNTYDSGVKLTIRYE